MSHLFLFSNLYWIHGKIVIHLYTGTHSINHIEQRHAHARVDVYTPIRATTNSRQRQTNQVLRVFYSRLHLSAACTDRRETDNDEYNTRHDQAERVPWNARHDEYNVFNLQQIRQHHWQFNVPT